MKMIIIISIIHIIPCKFVSNSNNDGQSGSSGSGGSRRHIIGRRHIDSTSLGGVILIAGAGCD